MWIFVYYILYFYCTGHFVNIFIFINLLKPLVILRTGNFNIKTCCVSPTHIAVTVLCVCQNKQHTHRCYRTIGTDLRDKGWELVAFSSGTGWGPMAGSCKIKLRFQLHGRKWISWSAVFWMYTALDDWLADCWLSSIYLSVCLYVCLSVCLPIHLSIYLSIYLSIIYPSIYLSISIQRSLS